MIKFAFNSSNEVIPISRASKGTPYRCIECGRKLTARLSAQRTPHFAHIVQNSCTKEAISIVHLKAQEALLRNYSSEEGALLEAPFPQISRIADLYIPSMHLIFEVQCSPISLEQLIARTNDYHAIGLVVVWIFHTSRYSPINPGRVQKGIQHIPHYYTNLNKEGEGFFFDALLYSEEQYCVNFKDPPLPLHPPLWKIHPLEHLRRKHWKLYFRGDLIDQLNKGQIPPLKSPHEFSLKHQLKNFLSLLFCRSMQ